MQAVWEKLGQGKLPQDWVSFTIDFHHCTGIVERNLNKIEAPKHLRNLVLTMHTSLMYLGHPLLYPELDLNVAGVQPTPTQPAHEQL